MNEYEQRIIIDSQSTIIRTAIDQLTENVSALKLAQSIIKERDHQIENLLKDIDDVDHWRKMAYKLQLELADMEKQRDRTRDIVALLEAETAQCMNTDWHSKSWR